MESICYIENDNSTSQEKRSHQCDVCFKQFSKLGTLKTHMLSHTGEKPFKCDLCHKRFPRKQNLNRHMLSHTGEKPYQCEVCQKRFFQSSHLKTHMTTHTDVKVTNSFQCEVCQKTFPYLSTLKSHMAVHAGEHFVECEVCHHQFYDSSHLRKHMRIHTEEKPFKCDFCDKSFLKSSSLKKHMAIHAGDESVEYGMTSEYSLGMVQTIEESGSSVEGIFGYHYLESEDHDWEQVSGNQRCDTDDPTESESLREVGKGPDIYEDSQAELSPFPVQQGLSHFQPIGTTRDDLDVSICSDEELERSDLLYLEDKTLMKLFRERETDKTNLSILKAFLLDGTIKLYCNNEETVEWLLKVIPTIKPRKPGASYRIYGPGHDPLCFIASLTHKRSARDAEVFDFLLRRANPLLSQEEIQLVGTVRDEVSNSRDRGTLVRIKFHRNHLAYLKECNFNLLFGWGQLQLRGSEASHFRRKMKTEQIATEKGSGRKVRGGNEHEEERQEGDVQDVDLEAVKNHEADEEGPDPEKKTLKSETDMHNDTD